MAEMSISVSNGGVAREHNLRETISPNVNTDLCKFNLHLVDEKPEQAYDRIFGDDLKAYNAKQKRSDRVIDNYYQHIKKNHEIVNSRGNKNAMAPELEYVFAIGNMETNPATITDANGQLHWGSHVKESVEALKDLLPAFKSKFPKLEVTGYDIHLDEKGAIHAHLRFIPVAEGYKNGLAKQPSFSKALVQMGYDKTVSRGDMAVSHFRHDCMSLLEDCCRKYDMTRKDMNCKRPHVRNGVFQNIANELQGLEQNLAQMRTEKADLTMQLNYLKGQVEEQRLALVNLLSVPESEKDLLIQDLQKKATQYFEDAKFLSESIVEALGKDQDIYLGKHPQFIYDYLDHNVQDIPILNSAKKL